MKLTSLGVPALVFAASVAHADAPADLPLNQVVALLRDAGISEAWSITQNHSPKAPWTRTLSVLSNRKDLGDHICRTEESDINLAEKGGKTSVANVDKHVLISFRPWACMWGAPESFHGIEGPADLMTLRRLQKDLATIHLALDGTIPADVKVTFRDAESRKLFAPDVQTTEIDFIESSHEGHSRFGFFTGGRDILEAPEILCIEVVPGKITELQADICAVVDIVKTKE